MTVLLQSEISADDFINRLADALASRIIDAKNTPEKMVGISVVAAHFGVSVNTVYAWNSQGCPHTNNKPVLYKISAVEEWLSGNRKPVNRRSRRLLR
jgi:hypothetical protein